MAILDRKNKVQKGITISEIEGMLHSRTKYCIIMDADFQHPCELVRNIARELKKGNMLVIATRRHTINWELHRKIASEIVKKIGIALLILNNKHPSNDPFSGFFGIECIFFRELWKQNNNLFLEGRLMFEILKRVDRSTKIKDVPYVFRSRDIGVSKMGIRQGIAIFKSYFIWG